MKFTTNITIAGNAVAEPELRFTKTSKAVANFTVAVNTSKKVGDDWENVPHYLDVTCWDKLAENAAENVAKGQRVVVVGRLKQQHWENNSGEKRSRLFIEADDVAASMLFLGTGSKPVKSYNPDEDPF